MRKIPFIIITILLLVITFFTSFFITKNKFSINQIFLTKKGLYNENLSLKKENQELKAQIFKIQQAEKYQQALSSTNIWLRQYQYKVAKLISVYPFNTKNTVLMSLGIDDGAKKEMPVVVSDNILFGQVEEVFNQYSVVKTIFDSSFQIPVRIGETEIDGFLTGGDKIKISLIEKSKDVKVGDVVYSSSSNFPYGLKIGEIKEINDSTNNNFKEAIISPSFNFNDLRNVYLIYGK